MNKRSVMMCLGVLVGFSVLVARGQTVVTWSGAGDGVNWSDGVNWVGGVAPSSGARLVFPSATNRGTVGTPLNANLTDSGQTFFTVDSIQFDNSDGAYYIGGNALKVTPVTATTGVEITSASTGHVYINNTVTVSSAARFTISTMNRLLYFNGAVTLNADVQLFPTVARPHFRFESTVQGSGKLNDSGGNTALSYFQNSNLDWSGGITAIGSNVRSRWLVGADGALGTGKVEMRSSGRLIISQLGSASSITLDNAFDLGHATAIEYLRFEGNFTIGSAANSITLVAAVTPPIDPVGTTTLAGAIVDGGNGYGLQFRSFTANFGEGTAGSGTIVISSTANTYSGATRVEGGALTYVTTLQVDGDITSSSGLTVGERGVLRGTGSTPAVTVESGGVIHPGNSVGTLNVDGMVTLGAVDAVFKVDLEANDVSGRLAITGGYLDLSSGGILSLVGTLDGSYTLATFDTTDPAIYGTFSSVELNGSTEDFTTSGYVVTYGSDSITLAIPEPGVLALLAMGAGLLALRRRFVK